MNPTLNSNSPPAGLLAAWKAALRRDPRRTGLLAVLVAVLAVLWGRMLIGSKLPEAVASRLSSVGAVTEVATKNLTGRSAPSISLAEWAGRPQAKLDRNLFAVPFEYYPRDPAHPPAAEKHADDQLAKSATTQADQVRERQILVENLRSAAGSLTLEGTVLGTNPRAWVNGLLVGIGQPIGESGFRVARIESRRVFIERDGVEIELSMK